MVWVCGWVGFAGLEAPFAKASDLSEANKHLLAIAQQLQSDRIERLDLAIQSVRSQQCRTANDSPARQNYTERLNELFRKYQELTGHEPHVPRCDET
jgi:allophanate hydrolase subunit 1